MLFFFFKQKTAYEMLRSLVGSEMCIRDRGLLALIEPGVIPHAVTSISSILSSLTGLVVLVIAFIPGKVGPNAYGPDPKPAPTYEGYGQI